MHYDWIHPLQFLRTRSTQTQEDEEEEEKKQLIKKLHEMKF